MRAQVLTGPQIGTVEPVNPLILYSDCFFPILPSSDSFLPTRSSAGAAPLSTAAPPLRSPLAAPRCTAVRSRSPCAAVLCCAVLLRCVVAAAAWGVRSAAHALWVMSGRSRSRDTTIRSLFAPRGWRGSFGGCCVVLRRAVGGGAVQALCFPLCHGEPWSGLRRVFRAVGWGIWFASCGVRTSTSWGEI